MSIKQISKNSPLICPICKKHLLLVDNSLLCSNKHTYDISKEGYVNFLSGIKKSGDLIGDNPEMSIARAEFLNKNYYSALGDSLVSILNYTTEAGASILDLCCGNGYYSDYIERNSRKSYNIWGFDLSKTMVRLAAKKNKNNNYFVGNLANIPIENESFNTALHLFAPFNEEEYLRVLKKDGILLSVIPGERHLLGLKEALYEYPYLNDEKFFDVKKFRIIDRIKISSNITVINNADINNLLLMTPYYYRTSAIDKEKLIDLESLDTEIAFIIYILKK